MNRCAIPLCGEVSTINSQSRTKNHATQTFRANHENITPLGIKHHLYIPAKTSLIGTEEVQPNRKGSIL
jgi:hypothetical protein